MATRAAVALMAFWLAVVALLTARLHAERQENKRLRAQIERMR